MKFSIVVSTLAALVVVGNGVWVTIRERRRDDGVHLQTRSDADAFRVETFTLENGLQVITIPASGAARVTAMVWYKVGSADDPAGKSGLAHLLEHVTFRGIEAEARRHAARIAKHNTPEADAFTSHDYTAYYYVVPTTRLETVLQTEARRMANLLFTHDTLLILLR